jgi:hypothetical protein
LTPWGQNIILHPAHPARLVASEPNQPTRSGLKRHKKCPMHLRRPHTRELPL